MLRIVAVVAVVAAWSAPVLAQADPKVCATMTDDQARLKCIDAIFPGPAATAAWLNQPIEPPIPVRRVKTQRITADTPVVPAPGSGLDPLLGLR